MRLADRPASTSVPIHPLLAARWSTRAFAPEPLPREEVDALLEAMRWSPSCYNEQPWRVLVFDGSDAEARSVANSCLMDGNAWARKAPLLLLTAHTSGFRHNGKPNAHAAHDLGIANMGLAIQAQALGLGVHMLAGFDREKAATLFEAPDDLHPLVMIAVGRPGDPDQLSDELRARESGPRERLPLAEFVAREKFGGPAY